jgi:transposase
MKVKERVSREELQRLERCEQNVLKAKRLRIIILALEGWTAPSIAMAVGLSRRICQRWVRRYNELGVAGLNDQRGRKPQRVLSAEDEQKFRERIEAGPQPEDGVCVLRGVDFRRILEREFNVLRSLSSVFRLLHRLDYSLLMPRPRHRKANAEAQAAFPAQLAEQLQAIAQQHPDKRLRVYFEDEARFGQKGSMTRVWAKRGSRPTVVRQTDYKYTWVLAAVCPETGHAEGLISPRLNTHMINVFLEQLSRTIPADEHAVLLWDGAGFHRSKELQTPTNITLITLPPYSPELNPIENLWHYLKSHYWSNRVYADEEALDQAAVEVWRKAAFDPELLQTVCAAPYVILPNALV